MFVFNSILYFSLWTGNTEKSRFEYKNLLSNIIANVGHEDIVETFQIILMMYAHDVSLMRGEKYPFATYRAYLDLQRNAFHINGCTLCRSDIQGLGYLLINASS